MSDNRANFGAIGEGRAIRKAYPPRENRDAPPVAADSDVTPTPADAAAEPAADAASAAASPFRSASQPAFGVNICVELFGGSRIRKPMPRHSPCCKRYEYLRATTTVSTEVGSTFSRSDVVARSAASEEGSTSELIDDSSNSPDKFESGFASGGLDSPVGGVSPDVIPKHESARRETSTELASGSTDSFSTKLRSFAADPTRGLPDGEAGVSDDFKQFLAKFTDLKVVWEEQAKAREAQEPPVPAHRASLSPVEFGDSFDDCSQNVKMFFMKYAMTKSEENQSVDQ